MRIDGPTLEELDRTGDKFAEEVTASIRRVLNRTATGLGEYVSLDDLSVIQRHWAAEVEKLALKLTEAWELGTGSIYGGVLDAVALVADAVPRVPDRAGQEYLASATNRLAGVGNEVWEHARSELLTGMQAGEGVAKLRNRVVGATGLAAPRAGVIARTEVNGAANLGALAQMQAIEVPSTKEWVATSDSRTRGEHLAVDGVKVPTDGTFLVDGYAMRGPHDPGAPARLTVNCRCTLAFHIADDDKGQLALTEQEALAQGHGVEHLMEDRFDDPIGDALYSYKGPEYRGVNAALRGGGGDLSALRDYDRGLVTNIDAAFQRAPGLAQPVLVHRGVGQADAIFGPVGAKVGQTFVDHAFVSTTTLRWFAKGRSGFSGGAVLNVWVPSGAKALRLSGWDDEAELLLARGTQFRIIRDRVEDKIRVIDVEVAA